MVIRTSEVVVRVKSIEYVNRITRESAGFGHKRYTIYLDGVPKLTFELMSVRSWFKRLMARRKRLIAS